MNIAGSHIGGSAMQFLPGAGNELASLPGVQNSPGFGSSAFLAMFSAASETSSPSIPPALFAPSASGAAGADRSKEKIGIRPQTVGASPAVRLHNSGQQSAADANPSAEPTQAATVSEFSVMVTSAPGLVVPPLVLTNQSNKLSQQLAGAGAEPNPPAPDRFLPAAGYGVPAASYFSGTQAPIAFALQLTPKALNPLVPSDSVAMPALPQMPASPAVADVPAESALTEPVVSASTFLSPGAPELKGPASSNPETAQEFGSFPLSTAALPWPEPAATKSAPTGAFSENATARFPLPSARSLVDADDGGKIGLNSTQEPQVYSQTRATTANFADLAMRGLNLSQREVVTEPAALKKGSASVQLVEPGEFTGGSDLQSNVQASMPEPRSSATASKPPLEGRAEDEEFRPETAPAPVRNEDSSDPGATDRQKAASQDGPQDAAVKAAPSAKAPLKDEHQNAGDGTDSCVEHSAEILHLGDATPQPTAQSIAPETAREQDHAPIATRDLSVEAPPTNLVRPPVARGISLQLEGAPGVAVQVSERGGRIDVAVRSGDTQLNKSLQSGLGDLVSQLESRGFKADAWTPGSARSAGFIHNSAEASSSQQQPGQSGNWGSRHQNQGEPNPRRKHGGQAIFEQTLAEEDANTELKARS